MRTTPDEMAELGRRIAAKLRSASGATALFLPAHGVSALDAEGAAFADPAADRDCFAALREGLSGSAVAVVELANHLNDPPFGEAMADRLHQMITEGERDGAR